MGGHVTNFLIIVLVIVAGVVAYSYFKTPTA